MLRQHVQTREARGREEGCGGRRSRISSRRYLSLSGCTGDGVVGWRIIRLIVGAGFYLCVA
jgi:hypothetical protein